MKIKEQVKYLKMHMNVFNAKVPFEVIPLLESKVRLNTSGRGCAVAVCLVR